MIKPPPQVDEKFAWDEGEGDDTCEWWLTAHRRYFARQAAREGFDLEGNPLAVFDRFEIVWPLDFSDMIPGPKSDQRN
jgi:uncharacterized protein YhfF